MSYHLEIFNIFAFRTYTEAYSFASSRDGSKGKQLIRQQRLPTLVNFIHFKTCLHYDSMLVSSTIEYFIIQPNVCALKHFAFMCSEV